MITSIGHKRILRKLYLQGDINLEEFMVLGKLDEIAATEIIGDTNKDLFYHTNLENALLIKPRIFEDPRGFFLETYSQRKLGEAGVEFSTLQINHSMSVEAGVLRGLHFQLPPHTQAKIVYTLKGKIFDVLVDLRQDSPTFGAWESFVLSEANKLLLYVPQGFAHAFLTLEPNTEVIYKTDDFYAPGKESGIIWNDPDLNINWPIRQPILSDKDQELPNLRKLDNPF